MEDVNYISSTQPEGIRSQLPNSHGKPTKLAEPPCNRRMRRMLKGIAGCANMDSTMLMLNSHQTLTEILSLYGGCDSMSLSLVVCHTRKMIGRLSNLTPPSTTPAALREVGNDANRT